MTNCHDRISTNSSPPVKISVPCYEAGPNEPGVINVRKIHGVDGLPKFQMRLDLGLLQMEMSGRPDGVRPHGYESLLDYFENNLPSTGRPWHRAGIPSRSCGICSGASRGGGSCTITAI